MFSKLYFVLDCFVADERSQMLDDSLSRERNFPKQSPVEEPASTEGILQLILYTKHNTM